jgi:hypothetical protein
MFSPLHAEAPPAEAAHPKTFVAVLWPMFGPGAAIGLVELVAEIKAMPNVRVETYVHQAWPSLVDDLNALPPGTRSIVIGYSLGANSTAEVANRVRHVDEFVALQPSLLSWNPDIKGGSYDRFVEIYNPNTWETWGGMGSKKLVGPNIEYVANSDSHPGAQFSSQFRDLVKRDVARLSVEDAVQVAQAVPPPAPQPDEHVAAAAAPPPNNLKIAQADIAKPESVKPEPAKFGAAKPDVIISKALPPAVARVDVARAKVTVPAPHPVRLADASLDRQSDNSAVFLDKLSSTVDSGDLSGALEAEPQLTATALMDYAKRTYRAGPGANTLASNAF